MFHYKYAKHKSNYLRVTIPAGADCTLRGENGGADIVLQQGACTLVFPLFGESHTAVAQYEAGTFGVEQLMGETVVPYVYEQGKLRVCDYDYQHHGLWEKQYNDTPPYFRLLRNGKVNELTLAEPLLTVSSSKYVQAVGAALDQQEELTAAAAVIQNWLRTIYDRILEAVKGTGILLSIHKEDIIEKDDMGNIVGGAFVSANQNHAGYFYNVEGSTLDNRPGGSSWLDYYDRCLINPPLPPATPVPPHQKHRYCSSNGYNHLACNTLYYGGHVLLQVGGGTPHAMGANGYKTSGLSRVDHQIAAAPPVPGTPRFDQTFLYYILPICNQHNATGKFDVAMKTKLHGSETLLELNCFRSNYKW